MLAIISPAKTLDTESTSPDLDYSQPAFLPDADRLATQLKGYSAKRLGKLMSISDQLAELNVSRYQAWSLPMDLDVARPAILMFRGDVYEGMDNTSLSPAQLHEANQQVRILSGLYGLLRPLDLMLPYRLEMGCSIKLPKTRFGTHKLDAFWQNKVTTALNAELNTGSHEALINLASNEYAAAVTFKAIERPVIKIDFKEEANGSVKMVSFFAKKARGMMVRFMIEQKPQHPTDLQAFDTAGYRFNVGLSSDTHYIFTRPKP